MEIITYEENAIAMSKDARQEAAIKCGEKFYEIIRSSNQAKVDIVNLAREAGNYANIASGREQLTFNFAGIDFAKKQIMPHMPPGATINDLRIAVQVAKRIPKPISDISELDGYKQELNQVMVFCGLLEEARQRDLQSASGKNFFVSSLSKLDDFATIILKVEEDTPIENWSNGMLDDFLLTSRPIRDRIQRAEKIRLARAK